MNLESNEHIDENEVSKYSGPDYQVSANKASSMTSFHKLRNVFSDHKGPGQAQCMSLKIVIARGVPPAGRPGEIPCGTLIVWRGSLHMTLTYSCDTIALPTIALSNKSINNLMKWMNK